MGQLVIYFTSDPHFWHVNLSRIRGFATVEEMNVHLISRWNSVVQPQDTVYLLGDFVFGGAKKTLDILDRLNGRIVLVRGNHDKGMNPAALSRFDSVHELVKIKVTIAGTDLQHIVLCHFPLLVWDMCHHGSWHLHGHSHGSAKYPNPDAKILDVGFDVWDRPISLNEVAEIMSKRNIRVADHHKPKAD